jgi:hypothetical protein
MRDLGAALDHEGPLPHPAMARKVKGDLIELIDCGARSERLFHQSALEHLEIAVSKCAQMHVDNMLAGAIILVLHIIPFTPWVNAWCIRSGEHAADPEGRG